MGPPIRELLEIAIHRLPRRSARELRQMVEAIDDRFRSRRFSSQTVALASPVFQGEYSGSEKDLWRCRADQCSHIRLP
jgi:hypothetical protein